MVVRMAPRRHWSRSLGWTLVALALVAVLVEGFLTRETTAQQSTDPATNQGRKITLRDQLATGLRAFSKADFAFIDRVVVLVEQGKLPRRVVDGTFLWSRDRAARRSYTRRLRPMIYFRPALMARAKRIGVAL
jgi:hypothetical protein